MVPFFWRADDRRWVALGIVAAGALVAVSLLFLFRFQIAVSSGQIPLARLDRWTGAITVCTSARVPAPWQAASSAVSHTSEPPGHFDRAAALKAGYTPKQIDAYLATRLGYDLTDARLAGLSDHQIAAFLSTQPLPPEPAALSPAAFAAGTAVAAARRAEYGHATPMDCESPP